ncbi:Phosphoribosylformylglycinamidine synthase [Phycisphaerae bacterium RAS1]|nr:Phosphoribosylformylglycinamidine synthase [Phycisphaerae bacterium RAS1]
MSAVRVLILRAAGTNCDLETRHAWEAAGATAERVHIRRLIETPSLLDTFQVLTIPGGFSYGDDIAAGRVFAAQIRRSLLPAIRGLVDRGGLVLGICNGFQVLVQAGLLPFGWQDHGRICSVTYNDPPGFQDRWVCVEATTARCPFLTPGARYEMPIAHGEGRVVFVNDGARRRVLDSGLAALRYVRGESGAADGMPANPNGSEADIAGMCDETGRILGFMPHPERFVSWSQHPCWTSLPPREQGDGLALFQNAVQFLSRRHASG